MDASMDGFDCGVEYLMGKRLGATSHRSYACVTFVDDDDLDDPSFQLSSEEEISSYVSFYCSCVSYVRLLLFLELSFSFRKHF